MTPAQFKIKSVLAVAVVFTILPASVFGAIVLNQSSPSYDFGPSLVNRQYQERTATLYFTNTGADPQSGSVSLSASSEDIQFGVAEFNIHVNPGETVHEYIDIEFTPSSVGQFFENIKVITNFGASSNLSIIAACYIGCSIEGHIYDYITKEVIPASECTSPSFKVSNATGYFKGHWFAGSYEFTASANGYHSEVKHILLPENDSVPWNPELVPVIPLKDAISALQIFCGTNDPQKQYRIDLNQDGKLGSDETIIYLQILVDLRRQNRYDLISHYQSLNQLHQKHLSSPQ
jgi:hypothetical protein